MGYSRIPDLAVPLDLNGSAVCSICRTTSEGDCGEHVEATLVGIFARFRNLTHHVKGSERSNRNGYFRIFEIFAAEFPGQRFLKFGLRQA